MRFRFEADLAHQAEAIEAVCDLFKGEELNRTSFTIAPGEADGQRTLAQEMLSHSNRLDLPDGALLSNLQEIQARNGLEPDVEIKSRDFTVEMETGTGKTYVYLRTMFELNRRFGFTKFVIVVPSVAIREGVKKSIEQTREHFRALYEGAAFDSFVYDSANLANVRDFASSPTIGVMIVTIQSINSANNLFYDAREETQDIPAIEWIAGTRPVIIVDEPQSVDGGLKGAGREALSRMKPLATLRYSATHVEKFHQVYRLDALDAHERGLVKSIEVDGATIEDANSNAYVKLIAVEARPRHAPRARIELSIAGASSVRRDQIWVEENDDLFTASNQHTVYAGIRIGAIDARSGGSMQLALDGDVKTLKTGSSHAGVDADSLARNLIRRTIEHHFRKELGNRKDHIKTLSLFFVDRVADYREYDQETGEPRPGKLARMFEEEYLKAANDDAFRETLFAGVDPDPARAHGGYFSQDRKGRFTEPALNQAGEFSNKASREDAERIYHLIMRDKEKLLDEAEPLRFLFSHSALREGWDNPNVFQICTLREMATETRRRQSIGRGLRLCVDRDGARRRDEDLNVLTIISEESFADYARHLQEEMEEALDIKLGVVLPDLFAGIRYAHEDGRTAIISPEESRAVHEFLTERGMIEANGRTSDVLRSAIEDGIVPLPKELPEVAARLIRDRLARVIRQLKIRDANRISNVRAKVSALEGHEFATVWERIRHKRKYRLKFDDETLIETCANALKDMKPLAEARVTFELASIQVGREGLTTRRNQGSVSRAIAEVPIQVPDLLGELQSRTELPRSVLAEILVRSGRVNDATINPAAFLDACTLLIHAGKRLLLKDGIQYQECDDCWYAQELIRPDEPLSAATRVFPKLPRQFTVPTPLGIFKPDWAIVSETERGMRIYLVPQTNGVGEGPSFSSTQETLRAAS